MPACLSVCQAIETLFCARRPNANSRQQYRGKREIRGTKIRVIWGKVTRPHGTSSFQSLPLVPTLCVLHRYITYSTTAYPRRASCQQRTLTTPGNRKQRRRPSTVQAQSAPTNIRRVGAHHAVPVVDIIVRWGRSEWSGVGASMHAKQTNRPIPHVQSHSLVGRPGALAMQRLT